LSTSINFNIPKSDPGFDGTAFTIRPATPLPSVPAGTVIDGTSQTAIAGNTNAVGPEIVISGSLLGSFGTPGLTLTEANCTVRSIVVSGFPQQGILISGIQAVGNTVAGCYIGTNSTGTAALHNGAAGIELSSAANNNTIGGLTPADRKLISGNSGCGVRLTTAGTKFNKVVGNFIGLDASGSTGIANSLQGVAILSSAQDNVIGGSAIGAANRIWTNGQEGIAVFDVSTFRNNLSQNSIYHNGARGIVLYNNSNAQQAYPTINSVTLGVSDDNTGGIDISGSLTSNPSTSFLLEFFANSIADPSGFGQGQIFIGSTTVTTLSNGNRPFSIKLPAAVPTGYYVTAKATSPDGNSSSYSAARIVTSTDSDGDGMPNKYESAYKLDQNSAADANIDSDGDGLTNLQEFYAGTDPKLATSRLVVSSLRFVNGSPLVAFQCAAGKTYRVEFKDDLGTGSWKVLLAGIFSAQAVPIEIPDATGSTIRRAYRVVLER
jgi:hypothetical protein